MLLRDLQAEKVMKDIVTWVNNRETAGSRLHSTDGGKK
jgi:hypothetical protein